MCNRGAPIPDALLLEIFRSCLDDTDQKLLEIKREQTFDLTFAEFWASLQSMYDMDSVTQNRLAWEGVKLPPGELTLERWLSFLMDFQQKRDRVEDRTPHEEYTLLMKSLPELL